jgi:DNA-binding transcriptional regulator YhcF (GntR family)/DNA-binding LacI/PurR family transcriptional regulator
MRIQTPSLNKAVVYIESLRNSPGSQQAMLPAQRAMAKAAGVSIVTMSRAVSVLKTRGILNTVAGKGTIPAADHQIPTSAAVESQHPPSWRPARPLWQEIADRMEHALFFGGYDPARRLPSIKQLSSLHTVNYRTVRKALASLHASGRIEALGRGYRPAHHLLSAASAHVAVFIHSQTPDVSLTYRDTNSLRTIESLCRRASASMRIIRYFFSNDRTHFVDHASGLPWNERQRDDVLGCVWLPLFQYLVTDECCARIVALDKPVAMLDFGMPKALPPFFINSPRVKIFSIARDASLIAGEYLIRQGHRRIAYLSSYFDAEWSHKRLEGLNSIAKAAGLPASAIVPFVSEYSSRVGGKEINTADESRAILRSIARSYRHALKEERGALHGHLTEFLGQPLGHTMHLWNVRRKLMPLMQGALEHAGITAWVFGDDEEAILGLSFLKGQGVAVPGRISVVGVNDSLDAITHNLSSCSDNMDALLNGMVNHALYPRHSPKEKFIAIDGYLVERGTTGPVRI